MASAPGPERSASPQRLLVLPFANISADANDEYLADGMTEELISTLSRLSGLRVIARTSSMTFKGTRKSIAEIHRELNVPAILEGSIRKSGSRLRVSAKLIDARTEEHLWSEEYDRELEDVFAIQRELARRIARSLKVRIRRTEERAIEQRATEDVDAYALYLRGRFAWNLRTEAGLRDAINFFEQALAKDRSFALALSGIADSHAALALLEVVAPTQAFPQARDAAERALALDPTLAEAHTSLALVRFQYERDWSGAEAGFRRAIELNPRYPPGHQFFADYLKAMGRFDEAIAEMRRALELDPLSLAINTGLGHVLYLKRDYDAAIAQYRAAREMDPKFVTAHLWFGRPYLQTGRYAEAIAEVRQAVELSGRSTITLAVLAHAYASAGQRGPAFELLEELQQRAKSRYLPSYWIALVYAGLGEVDRALEWLERAYDERSSWLVWIKVEPRFDSLRGHPGFRSLLERMRLDGATEVGPSPSAEERAITRWLDELQEIRLSRYRVVGSYTRYVESTRNSLKDLKQRIVERLRQRPARVESFLLWAAPGSGKTFFVRELAKELGAAAAYVEINLAATDDRGFRARLAEAESTTAPILCLIDEVDAKSGESWPYEELLPALEPGRGPAHARVFVLAGSGGSSLDELTAEIGRRPKGSDLVSRIPAGNRHPIPPLTAEDRVLVAASNLEGLAGTEPIAEVEKLALGFVALRPELASPRQLRNFLARAVERRSRGDARLKYDSLFDAGDPSNKEFWAWANARAPQLVNRFVVLAE